MRNILFRADSSSIIGTGHIMRDLVLASRYKDTNIIFATQELDGNINEKIKEAGYKIISLQSNDIKELDTTIKKLKIDMLIIDHYDIDYNFEKRLKMKNEKLKIMVLDDTYEKHYCDILLNHNISANKKKYKDLTTKNCELKCGSKYTLLRDEFYKERKKLQQNSKFKIFLAMGGADHSNINIKILRVLEKFDNITVNLVTTTANKNLEELQKYAKNKKFIELHVNSNEIAKLMRKSNFAIVTPSVILNEVIFMKVPFIAIKTADNQDDMYKYLKKNNFSVLRKFKKNDLNEKLAKILYNKGRGLHAR